MKNQLPESIQLGREQLKASGNDLLTGIKKSPELTPEIMLAYFDHAIKMLALRGDDTWLAHEVIIGAAGVIDQINRDATQMQINIAARLLSESYFER